MSLAKNLAAFASAASGISIVLAIGVVGYMLNDINNFYDDALVELNEFKLTANGAWDHMTERIRSEGAREVRSVFHRKKKQSYGGDGGDAGFS
ncbi:unnamed protein product, partial [Cylicostephanus goldi]